MGKNCNFLMKIGQKKKNVLFFRSAKKKFLVGERGSGDLKVGR